jgi:importin-7
VQLGKIVEYHWKYTSVEQAKKVSVEGFEYIILDLSEKALVRDNLMKSLYMATNRAIIK